MRSTLAGTVRTQQGEIYLNGDADWSQIENWRARVQSISAKGITAEHMRRSAEFVAEELIQDTSMKS